MKEKDYNFKISWSFWGCNRKYKKWGYVLQQDGSTCYTTTGSIFFIIRKANVFLGFPSNSSDLSPIENLWAIIRDKKKKNDELKKLVLKIYDGISIDTINPLIYSCENSLQMCLNFGGKTIAHFLRKHFEEIPPQYKVPLDQ